MHLSLRLALVIVICSCFNSLPLNADSQLMEELQRELDPALTQPIVIKQRALFKANNQSVQHQTILGNSPRRKMISKPVPSKTRSLGSIADTGSGSKLGTRFTISARGNSSFEYQNKVKNHTFSGDIPIEVAVKLPAPKTIAPGQEFTIESSWSTLPGFRYETSGPEALGFKADMEYGLDGTIGIEVCVGECIDISTTWRIDLPTITLFNFETCRTAELNSDNFALGFIVDICDLLDVPEVVDLSKLPTVDEPYTGFNILNEKLPGVFQLVLYPDSFDLSNNKFARSSSQSSQGGVGRVLTDQWTSPMFGVQFDITNFIGLGAKHFTPSQNPPLNGDLEVLIDWYAPPPPPGTKRCPSFPKNPSPECFFKSKFGSLFKYNLVDTTLGIDFSVSESYAFAAKAPMIRLSDPDRGISWQFRAGNSKRVRMPDNLDTSSLVMEIVNTQPTFELETTFGFIPRLNVSTTSFSFGLPTILGGSRRIGLPPLFDSGNIFGDIINDPEYKGFVGNSEKTKVDVVIETTEDFAPLEPDLLPYILEPTQRPSYINGRDLAQVDGDTKPRLIKNPNDENELIELNFAIVDFTLSSAQSPVVIEPAGLGLRNTQVIGNTFANLEESTDSGASGTFHLIGRSSQENFLAMAGDALRPGLDGVTINSVIFDNNNTEDDQNPFNIITGVAFANNYGGYLRNSYLDLAPRVDGTLLIASVDQNGNDYETVRGPLGAGVNVNSRLEVYSGITDEATSDFKIVELEIENSLINARQLVLNDNAISPVTTSGNYKNPVDVTVEGSIIHANIEIQDKDNTLTINDNSLVTGRDEAFSRNEGRIFLNGGIKITDVVNDTGLASVSLLDSGVVFNNSYTPLNECGPGTVTNFPDDCPEQIFSGIFVDKGGVVSVLSGNNLNDGRIQLNGSSNETDSRSMATLINGLEDGYSPDDLFTAASLLNIQDAILLLDGGQIDNHTIVNRGGTFLALTGILSNSIISTKLNGNILIDHKENEELLLDRSQFNGAGDITIGDTSKVTITQTPNDGLSYPVIKPTVGSISLINDGEMIISGGTPVQLTGGTKDDVNLQFSNNGLLHVEPNEALDLIGNTVLASSGSMLIEGRINLRTQYNEFIPPEGGGPVSEVTTPVIIQDAGQVIVDGAIDLTTANESNYLLYGGLLKGAGSIFGDVVNISGTVEGSVTNRLIIDGSYRQTENAVMQIKLDSSGVPLIISGQANLAGILKVIIDPSWWNNIQPNIGDQYTALLSNMSILGAFTSIVAEFDDGSPLSDSDLEFGIEFTSNQVMLTLQELTDAPSHTENLGIDFTGPEITVPADVTTEASGILTQVDIGNATATDATSSVDRIFNDAPNGFPEGTTIVTWTAIDEHDNATDGEQFITITAADFDLDGMPDYYETLYGFNLFDADDANLDFDNDGLTNLEEYQQGTRPDVDDTDGDGMDDSFEIENGFDPLVQDCPDWFCGGSSKIWLWKLIKDRQLQDAN